MKCFMPVYALALALAVTSDMFHQVSGAACDAATVCVPGTTCTEVADGKTTVASLERPALTVLAACPTGKFAYIKSLVVVPDSGVAATTTAPATTTVAPATTTAAPATTTAAPATTTVAPATTVPPTTSATPPSSSPPAAGGGTGARRHLATAAVATVATDIKVTFTKDGTASSLTSAAATPVTTGTPVPCDNTYADIGKDATGDVKATIGCASTAANCKFKYKVEWACQEAASTPTPTPSATSGAVVAGASPAVTLGVALVAAVAGANLVVPL